MNCEKKHTLSSHCPLDIIEMIIGTILIFVVGSFFLNLAQSLYIKLKRIKHKKPLHTLQNVDDTEKKSEIQNEICEYDPPSYAEIAH